MEHTFERTYLETYDELADDVFKRCLYKTSDREIALDLTQDTFIKVWDYLVEGGTVEHMRAFVFTVANNLIKDHYKKKKSIPMGRLENFDPNEIAAVEETFVKEIEFEHVLRLLERLEREDRDLLFMRLVEGMSPKEISEILEERENTVSVRIHRAIKKLQVIGNFKNEI
jgi:RNA polymerase sigma-70 factor (ECF subfamily)